MYMKFCIIVLKVHEFEKELNKELLLTTLVTRQHKTSQPHNIKYYK